MIVKTALILDTILTTLSMVFTAVSVLRNYPFKNMVGVRVHSGPVLALGAIIESHRYHIKARRDLFYDGSLKDNIVVDLQKTNKIKSARGYVKQEINSHLDMLDHHEYFDLTFDVVYNEEGTRAVIQGYDDAGYLRYNYFVWIEDNGN